MPLLPPPRAKETKQVTLCFAGKPKIAEAKTQIVEVAACQKQSGKWVAAHSRLAKKAAPAAANKKASIKGHSKPKSRPAQKPKHRKISQFYFDLLQEEACQTDGCSLH